MAKKTVPALAIAATSAKGFRRAGRLWGPGTQTVAQAEFSPAQLEALESEAGKGLVVARTTMEVEVPDEALAAAPAAEDSAAGKSKAKA
jgi:hypothetical protein